MTDLLDAALRQDNLNMWLELEALRDGTPNQRERWAVKALPDDELTMLARQSLFMPLSAFQRWQPISVRQVPHRSPLSRYVTPAARRKDDVCPTRIEGGPTLEQAVTFETRNDAALSHDEWEIAREIIAASSRASRHEWCRRQGVAFQSALRTHVGRCTACESEIAKSSILISVRWAGRLLSREYAL